MHCPHAIMLMGLPASGKTTYALSSRFAGFRYIAPELFPGLHHSIQMNKVRNMVTHAVYNGMDIIIDDCNPTCADRKFHLDAFNEAVRHVQHRPDYIPYTKECHHLQATMKQVKYNAAKRRDQGGDRINRNLLVHCARLMREPSKSEGFHSIVNVDFAPQKRAPVNRAIFFSLDGVVRSTRGKSIFCQPPKHVMLDGNRNKVFRWYYDEGYKFIGITHLSAVAGQRASEATAQACIVEMVRQLKVPIEAVFYCAHRKEEQCSCFPPSPYFAKLASKQYQINLQKSIMVGSIDKYVEQEFARKAGIGHYVNSTSFYNQDRLMMVR